MLPASLEREIEAAAQIRDHEARLKRLETLEGPDLTAIGGYALIEEKAPSGVTFVTFSGITAIYRHLRLFWFIQSTTVSAEPTAFIQFNGDTTAGNYNWTNEQMIKSLTGAGDIYAIAGASDNDFPICQVPGSHPDQDPEEFAHGIADIPYYAKSHWKGIESHSQSFNTSRDNVRLTLFSGRWKGTAPISSITFGLFGGNFEDDSLLSLYGLS